MSSVFVFHRKIFQYLSSDRPAGNKKAPGETEKNRFVKGADSRAVPP